MGLKQNNMILFLNKIIALKIRPAGLALFD